MCRITTTDLYDDGRSFGGHHFLNIRAFYLKLDLLSVSPPDHPAHQQQKQLLQDSNVLLYLPRINTNNNNRQLSLDDDFKKTEEISLNSPGYFTLHRFSTHISDVGNDSVLFGTRDKFQVEEGAMFSVYLNGEKLLKGIFKRPTGGNVGWTMDSTCFFLEGHGLELLQAEVSVVPDARALELGLSTMTVRHNRVKEMASSVRNRARNQNRRRRLRHRSRKFQGLEQIPEEGETESECGSSGKGSDVEEDDCEHLCPAEEAELEAEMEGVSWAVDMGLWAVGLGLGYLVSRASARRLRRTNVFCP